MVKHNQNIVINSNIEKSWGFLIDLSRSLIFDRFFTRIELPSKYSINQEYIFTVKGNYFFSIYNMKANILKTTPPSLISIKFSDKNLVINKKFILSVMGEQTILSYNFEGDFGNVAKNILIFPFIKLSCLNELRYIKKAMESSEFYPDKKINTASSYK